VPDYDRPEIWTSIESDLEQYLEQYYLVNADDELCVILLAAARARCGKAFDNAAVEVLRKSIPVFDRYLLADRYINEFSTGRCADTRGLRYNSTCKLIKAALETAHAAASAMFS
jgi:hypothetical protein